MHDRLAVHGNAGGPRLSAPSICPIAEGVIKYRGALGKPEINTGAWAPAKPGLIRLPNRRDHDDCLLDADRGGDDAVPHHRARQVGRGVDNRAPRPSLESLSGWRQRADWAHRNHFEAFPAFAAVVFVAELVTDGTLNAMIFCYPPHADSMRATIPVSECSLLLRSR